MNTQLPFEVVSAAAREGDTWVSGQETSLLAFAPRDKAWDALQLKARILSPGGTAYFDLDPWYIEVDGKNNRLALGKYVNGNYFEAWDFEAEPGSWLDVEVAAGQDAISIGVNGQRFSYPVTERWRMTSARIFFIEGVRFQQPELWVHPVPEPFVVEPSNALNKALEFTVDFFDDMQLAAFDRPMLDSMFEVMAGYGASKAYWIHHGDRRSGLWNEGTAVANIQQSFDNLGDDFLPAAVASSHKAGLPLVGILKVFDTALCHYTRPAGESGHADALGGRLWRVFNFPADHPEYCMQRRTPPTTGQIANQIVVRSRKRLDPALARQLEIYVSDDNESYTLYEKPFEVSVNGNEIAIDGLILDHTFVALRFPSDAAGSIVNSLYELASLRDAKGNELEFTYGINMRVRRSAGYHLEVRVEELDFRTHGLNFDCAGNTMPSANCVPSHRMLNLFSLQETGGVLGLALTTNAQAPGVPAESEPAVHDWWLSIISDMLAKGVDGVEIRLMNHSNIIDWSQYGFNQPVIAEYRRRHGIDITREDFSREEFRRIRGEYFTAFLRDASALTRSNGRSFYLHIEETHQGPASEPCPMEIDMPWRDWIREGLCDGVTLKTVNFWAHDSAFGREVLALCRQRGIPVSFTPFIHIATISNLRSRLLEHCMTSPFEAFNIYEFASMFKFTPQGEVLKVDDGMAEWLRSQNWKR